jgi:hypothetical protein
MGVTLGDRTTLRGRKKRIGKWRFMIRAETISLSLVSNSVLGGSSKS